MSTTFGYDFAADTNDRYVTLADRILTVVSELLQPGGTLINVIPILRYIPPWFPGASSQRAVAKAKKLWLAYKNEPFEYVKSRLVIIHVAWVCGQLNFARSLQDHQRTAFWPRCWSSVWRTTVLHSKTRTTLKRRCQTSILVRTISSLWLAY